MRCRLKSKLLFMLLGLGFFFQLNTLAQHATGLWVGYVTVDRVSRASSGTNVTWDITSMESTPSELSFRILIHVDDVGQARLLQRVVLATADEGRRVVLLTDESKTTLPFVETEAMQRLSSIAFPVMDPVIMVGTIDAGFSLSATVLLDHNDPSNPFKHRYHPDHDNLDESFAVMLGAGEESFTIQRDIMLLFQAAAADETDPLYGHDLWSGDYTETIAGLHRDTLYVGGAFTLERVLEAALLDQ